MKNMIKKTIKKTIKKAKNKIRNHKYIIATNELRVSINRWQLH
jgi:hypothetical protein